MSSIKVFGIDEVDEVLNRITPRNARNLMRATVQAVASRAAKQAKQNAPKDSGTLRKAIKAKRKKSAPNRPRSEVIVEHGAGAKNDAFYWRFIEYGTSTGVPEDRYLGRAIDTVSANLDEIIKQEFGQKLEKALARQRKKIRQGAR